MLGLQKPDSLSYRSTVLQKLYVSVPPPQIYLLHPHLQVVLLIGFFYLNEKEKSTLK